MNKTPNKITADAIKTTVEKTKKAAGQLLSLSARERKSVLIGLAGLILKKQKQIIGANLADIRLARKNGKAESFIERLSLDKNKIVSLADSLKQVAGLPDILFKTIKDYRRPSGLKIKKVKFPLGLIAMIYESRPNVTVDAFALCFKSGNAVILKGGREIAQTNRVLVALIKQVLKKHKINTEAISDLSLMEQKLTSVLIADGRIDCLIPRGGKGLISYVRDNAKVPVIITGASVVHTYVDESADLQLAKKVILNAKTRRVSICNALDVILLHKNIREKFLKIIAKDLQQKNVELRADKAGYAVLKKLNYAKLKLAGAQDFQTEFLDYILAVKTVNSFQEALAHIQKHSFGHSEAIITKNKKQAAVFFKKIDAACLYLNTSTQFSDGGEYGLGAELGISTQKLHARGPFAHEELTTYKYLVESRGATRK